MQSHQPRLHNKKTRRITTSTTTTTTHPTRSRAARFLAYQTRASSARSHCALRDMHGASRPQPSPSQPSMPCRCRPFLNKTHSQSSNHMMAKSHHAAGACGGGGRGGSLQRGGGCRRARVAGAGARRGWLTRAGVLRAALRRNQPGPVCEARWGNGRGAARAGEQRRRAQRGVQRRCRRTHCSALPSKPSSLRGGEEEEREFNQRS